MKKIDPETFIVDQRTQSQIIHYAAHFGKTRPLRVLVELHGVSLNTPDGYGCTVPHYAARAGQLHTLVYCREQGQIMDLTDRCSFTPAMYALMNCHVSCLVYLIFECGADLKHAQVVNLSNYIAAQAAALEVI